MRLPSGRQSASVRCMRRPRQNDGLYGDICLLRLQRDALERDRGRIHPCGHRIDFTRHPFFELSELFVDCHNIFFGATDIRGFFDRARGASGRPTRSCGSPSGTAARSAG